MTDFENIREAGSPPRVRGKGWTGCLTTSGVWITPAGAGKRRPCMTAPPPCKDHPRGCGEKVTVTAGLISSLGSPPRVRGKDSHPGQCSEPNRITPAGAGKSGGFSLFASVGADHPRGCGEKLQLGFSAGTFTGSPPRVRGKVFVSRSSAIEDRITPAGAGKSYR